MKKMYNVYNSIISVQNLLIAWKEFLPGKKDKKDVVEFSLRLMDSMFLLHQELKEKRYVHSSYHAFNISDPKPRNIHKASVRDRLLHHALYRILYPHFDKKFIFDSYSCRKWKGTHRALDRFRDFGRKISKNNTRTCWVLKCDIRKFFASIDHQVLHSSLKNHIEDSDTLWLLQRIIESFCTASVPGVGLPLGNLTSQLLVNVYMNEFDQYVKHKLKVKYYIRYADDFVILSDNKDELEGLLEQMRIFLKEVLKLDLHPKKVFIKTLASGVDFLGWVHFPCHRVLRTATKRKMFRRLKDVPSPATIASYKGMLSHGNGYALEQYIDFHWPKG